MRVASVCSGIGGAELAFSGIAYHAFAAETDPFARAVLAHRFPDLKVHHDFTQISASAGPVDVLVGGTPCQSFSIAGLRGGMADARGNLALEFLRLAERLRARWVLWENVPGVLSSNDGRDFGAFIGGLAELGYGYCWRSLDAQHFGLAQRRVRVFVVGYLGDWRRAAAVLFEPASLRGDPAPSGEAGKTTAAASVVGPLASGGTPNGHGTAGINRQAVAAGHVIANPLGAKRDGGWRGDLDNDTYIAFDARQSDTITYGDMSGPLDTDGHSAGALAAEPGAKQQTYAYTLHGAHKTVSTATETNIAGSIRTKPPGSIENSSTTAVLQTSAVRRLTPRECERLQGFPDGWTDVVYRGKPAADGPRYRALGNAFAVPVVRWIARRIVREDAASAQPGVLAA